jgi:hypothetical protein
MITVKQFAAALGFAFVAVWIEAGFGFALLCLVGALAFYAAASLYQGDLEREVGEIQSRFGRGSSEPLEYARRPAGRPPRTPEATAARPTAPPPGPPPPPGGPTAAGSPPPEAARVR